LNGEAKAISIHTCFGLIIRTLEQKEHTNGDAKNEEKPVDVERAIPIELLRG
jgi:hypothetical protein